MQQDKKAGPDAEAAGQASPATEVLARIARHQAAGRLDQALALLDGLIALALARARLLVMRRHPLDCLLSNYTQHFGQNQPFSADFDHLAQVWTVFDEMTRFWQEALPGRVRAVSYEAVVQDPEGQMRPVLDWLGLDWNPAMLDFAEALRPVVTASQAQVRAPLNTGGIGRWQRHARHLRPLAARLRAHLAPEDLARCGLG